MKTLFSIQRASLNLLGEEEKLNLFYPAIFNIAGDKEERINFGIFLSQKILEMLEGERNMICCKISNIYNKIETIDLTPNQSFYKDLESNQYCNLSAFRKHNNLWVLKAKAIDLF